MNNFIYKPYQLQVITYCFRNRKIDDTPKWVKYRDYRDPEHAQNAAYDLLRGCKYGVIQKSYSDPSIVYTYISRFRIIRIY